MEELIRVEVVQLLESIEKEVGQPVHMANRFNISIINALWTIITGKRHDLVSLYLANKTIKSVEGFRLIILLFK